MSQRKNIPPVLIATGVLEAMKLVKILWERQGHGPVSPEFLEAMQALVDGAADTANDLDRKLPSDD